MKLATLNDGTRDGQLAVVSRDLKTAHIADGIAPTLQAALDDWAFIAPQLDELSRQLNEGKARNAEMPESFWHDPLMYQGGSDDFIGPTDDIVLASEEWGIDFEAEVAVVTGDVPMGATPDDAHQQIRLLMLANDVSLRNLIPDELAKGFGFLQSKPATSFAPLAVTADELGEAWRGGKVHLALRSVWNGHLVGQPDAGVDMVFNFPQLVAHLAKTRNVRAGSIVGSGTVSNKDASRGYSCIAEKRCLEMIADGAAATPFMRFGDTIRIEMLDEKGKSVFGAIEQVVKKLEK